MESKRLLCTGCGVWVQADDVAEGEMTVHKNHITFICPYCEKVCAHFRRSDEPFD